MELHCPKGNPFSAIEHEMQQGKRDTRRICHVVSRFPLHFMLYRGNLDYLLNSVQGITFCICSARDRLGFYEEILIIFGTMWGGLALQKIPFSVN